MSSVDIQLNRVSKLYHENVIKFIDPLIININENVLRQENLQGSVIFDSKSESRHDGITLSVEGTVNMQLSSKSVGLFEAVYNSVRVSCQSLELDYLTDFSSTLSQFP